MRIAKAMARAGLCSRRDAERWIEEGRVAVNGKTLDTPACDVGPKDRILVDGEPLPHAEPPRLWRYHKPRGQVTSHRDPEGRPTVFDNLPDHLPRVISIGRLDFNTEGLLLLTTDGDLARHLELPATGWLRRYRVRAYGQVGQEALDSLKDGVEIDGFKTGPIEATLDSTQGQNVWLTIGLREGKNREVRRILETLSLTVNRLIRVSYGPFQLMDLAPGSVESVRRRVLADQLGPALAAEFGLDAPDGEDAGARPGPRGGSRPRGEDRREGSARDDRKRQPRRDGPGSRDRPPRHRSESEAGRGPRREGRNDLDRPPGRDRRGERDGEARRGGWSGRGPRPDERERPPRERGERFGDARGRSGRGERTDKDGTRERRYGEAGRTGPGDRGGPERRGRPPGPGRPGAGTRGDNRGGPHKPPHGTRPGKPRRPGGSDRDRTRS